MAYFNNHTNQFFFFFFLSVKPSVQAATFSSDTAATMHGMHGSDVPKDDTSATPCNTAGMTASPNINAGVNHSSLAHAANHSKPAQINSVKGNLSRQIFLNCKANIVQTRKPIFALPSLP
jgi:hypothetical protein